MQLLQPNTVLFSPTDLVAFLECQHSSLLTRTQLGGEKITQREAGLALLQQKGFEHEYSYLEILKNEHEKVVEISRNISRMTRVEYTLQAMREGADVIYQAAFYISPWCGDADFLIKCAVPSSLGNYSYEVLDTKLARRPEPKHLIQVCAYSDFLEHIQDLRPELVHLFLGNRQKHSFQIADFFSYYTCARQRFEAFQTEYARIKTPAAIPCPMPCSHCDFCAWKDMCAERWEREEHLCLVANIQRGQIEKLHDHGISSLSALATAPEEEKVPGMQPKTFNRLHSQAALQVYKRRTGESRLEILPLEEGRGFQRLPKSDDGDMFFDMEGDPYYPGGLEYLFGVYYATDDKYVYASFWGHDHQEEKEAFHAFMAFVENRLADFPDAHIYHYNHYEPTALKRLACRYALCEEQLDILLRQRKFVDLYAVVRESMRTSEPGYSIKNIEAFYLPKRKNAVTSAGDSVIMYNRWRELNDPSMLKDIEDYNEVDCFSTFKLREWLLSLRPEDLPWFKVDSDETMDDAIIERKPWEIEYEEYSELLISTAGQDDAEIQERALMAHLLEFHRREAKPQWWSKFARQDKWEEKLLDDVECIACMRLQGTPERVRRSLVHTYSFPSQEYKIKEKDTVVSVEDGQTAGTILSLDDYACILKITCPASRGILPEYLHIGPQDPINSQILRSALYRFADNILENQQKGAGHEILRRSLPRLVNKEPGEPVINGKDVLAESIEAVANLQDSYLFIQGPPGTGKTYTSSHIIVELMRRGHRVGVSSNSHKGIHNLLRQVERVAGEKNIAFTGIKKSSAGKDETVFEGAYIHSVSSKDEIPLNSNLYAGTAWLFADALFDGFLDYLFIDEAGQVSLANVIAMSGSTRNIVLVGDQMQLGQPVQGTHPGESGTSVLEYLLCDEATIATERGIFLAETRRMAPAVCSFISETFYDGRLTAHPDTNLRRLELPPGSGIHLPAEGIAFVEAEHQDCSQKSREEGDIIFRLYKELLGAIFHDLNGHTRSLSEQDILVVSPYNMQVNLLQSMLPEGARVGTVDKFQGQEAPVVIFSMATSSAEDMPRNIEFLFSKNRLNVAISRAQCLAVVVASPALAQTPCKTVEQMRLVNAFCRLHEYAHRINSENI